MQIKLDLPRGQRQQDFLDYLNAALRSRMSSSFGSSKINEDGTFESIVTGPFSIDQALVPLSWLIKKDDKGTLLSINIDSADTQIAEEVWKTAIHEFVTSVLAATLAETRKKHFLRSMLYYIGPQLDGEYWLPGYRFAPVFAEDPNPHLMNAERVVSIDQEVAAIDQMHAFSLADESSRRHAARLTLLLDTALYRQDSSQRWVWPIVDDKPATESIRCQLGFVHPSRNISEMPRKGEKCPLGSYKGSLSARYRMAGELLSLPAEARKILRSVDNADPVIIHAFDCGSRLYQVAAVCGSYFPSVGLAYRVAAVEAVCQADRECKGFSEFMRKYIASQQHIDELLDYLYGVIRSSHFHGGEFPLGEFDRRSFFDPLMNAEVIQRDSIHRVCYELTREAIVNWITRLIPDTPRNELEAS